MLAHPLTWIGHLVSLLAFSVCCCCRFDEQGFFMSPTPSTSSLISKCLTLAPLDILSVLGFLKLLASWQRHSWADLVLCVMDLSDISACLTCFIGHMMYHCKYLDCNRFSPAKSCCIIYAVLNITHFCSCFSVDLTWTRQPKRLEEWPVSSSWPCPWTAIGVFWWWGSTESEQVQLPQSVHMYIQRWEMPRSEFPCPSEQMQGAPRGRLTAPRVEEPWECQWREEPKDSMWQEECHPCLIGANWENIALTSFMNGVT